MLQLDSSALWGIVGLVGGLLISAFFYLIGKKKKILTYSIDTVTLVTKTISQIPNLEIYFKGKRIEDLSSSKVIIENKGNEVIEISDFASLDPLRIEVESGDFFITEDIIKNIVTSKNINLKIQSEDNNLKIDFEFLKPKTVLEFIIWHTGVLKICGDLKSGKLKDCSDYPFEKRFSFPSIFLSCIACLTISICLLLMIVNPVSFDITTKFCIFIIYIISVVVILFIYLFYSYRRLLKQFKKIWENLKKSAKKVTKIK